MSARDNNQPRAILHECNTTEIVRQSFDIKQYNSDDFSDFFALFAPEIQQQSSLENALYV